MLSGGGTGGGVYPALAVAAALEKGGEPLRICWVGSRDGVERELVKRHGLDYHGVSAGPLHGVNPLRAAGSLLKIVRGVVSSLGIMRAFRPDVLLLTGGWVTFPVAIAARLRRVPVMILLPDIEPAAAIRVLSRLARRVAVPTQRSFEYFRPGLAVMTGYPVRPELTQAVGAHKQAMEHFSLDATLPTLLVFGGSRGARSINRALIGALEELLDHSQVIHVSGTLDWPSVRDAAGGLSDDAARRYHPYAYLHDDMGLAFAAADLVVSRAGAGILGEFPLFGLPAIVVPYPHAWRYQKVNADYLVSRGAATQLADATLNIELLSEVKRLLEDEEARNAMAAHSLALAVPDAAKRVASELRALAQESRGNN